MQLGVKQQYVYKYESRSPDRVGGYIFVTLETLKMEGL
jgi:hypothetical protein